MKLKSLSLLLLLCPLIVDAMEKEKRKSASPTSQIDTRNNRDIMLVTEQKVLGIDQKIDGVSDSVIVGNKLAQKSLGVVQTMSPIVNQIQESMVELHKDNSTYWQEQRKSNTVVDLQNQKIDTQLQRVLLNLDYMIECSKNKAPLVKHTLILSPDLQRLNSSDNVDELETLGGERVALKELPVLKVTQRNIDLDVKQDKSGWVVFGAKTKEGRAEMLANNPAQSIPANQIFQARTDVDYYIGELTHALKLRPVFTEIQSLLQELKKEQTPLVEKIECLFKVGLSYDKETERVTVKQLGEQRKRIFQFLDLAIQNATESLELIQGINNFVYEKTKGDQDIVGAADNLNYKNSYLLTALVLQNKKELEEKKLEVQSNSNQNTDEKK